MASKVQTILVDDIDGGAAVETVSFGLDGVNYEIDLSEGNASALRDALASWVGHARKTGGRSTGRRRASRSAGSSGSSGGDSSSIREWARANGYTVSDRGRISGEVRAAYDAAH